MLTRNLLLVLTSVVFLSSCSTTSDDIVEKADSLFKNITGQPDVVEVEDRTTTDEGDTNSSTVESSTEENIVVADSSSYTSQNSGEQSNSSTESTSISSSSDSSSSSSESSSSSSSESSSSSSSESSSSSSSGSTSTVNKVTIIEKSPLDKLKDTDISFTLYFTYDGFDIDEDSTKEIIKHANYMRDNPRARLRLEGHADERGTREYNLALGENRALSVQEVLGLYDLASRIDVVSYGEEKPISNIHDESGWKQNRRVEFIYE